LLVEKISSSGVTRVLIDTSPDLREQLLDHQISHLDGVLITHEHADHTHGIDDLRPLVIAMRQRIPFYVDEVTSAILRKRFGYCFETPPESDYPPILDERPLVADIPVTIEGKGGAIAFTPFILEHGAISALGFRFDDVAYVPDVNIIPLKSECYLEGLDCLIIDALRYAPHPTHFHLAQTLDAINRFKPKRAILTNLHTDMDYATLSRELPAHVTPAYDNMDVVI
jgi:phosphoribosyl 1,2-cyclic phosphate phosphodiesterase